MAAKHESSHYFSLSDNEKHTMGVRWFCRKPGAKVVLLVAAMFVSAACGFYARSTIEAGDGQSFLAELPRQVRIVEIEEGSVLGQQSREFGQQYLGIPYGVAQRFEKAHKPPRWYPAVLDATRYRASCLRKGSAFMAEDCLHLNVHTPLHIGAVLHPVVVWFHGGSFTMGAGSDTTKENVQKLVNTHRLVVVTINYRLGVFGFMGSEKMRLGPDASVGNWGTLDQQLALKWVQNNINKFGGDPASVTVLGWSAGAASISVHLAMKSSWGLFKRAIMMSGGFTDWAAIPMRNAEALYDQTVANVGCGRMKECHMAGPICQCLRAVSGDTLANRQPSAGWGPVIDGVELPRHPQEALVKGLVQKGIAIIIGGAREDTMVDIGAAASEDNFKQFLYHTRAPVGVFEHYTNPAMAQALYSGPVGSSRRGWSPAYWAVRSAAADKSMNCKARHAAQMWHNVSGGAHAYYYVWDAPAPNLWIEPPSQASPSKNLRIGSCWPCPGAGHGSDLPYLFEHSKLNTDDDVTQLADVYQALFTDFVRRGNPNDWNGFFFSAKTENRDVSKEAVAWMSMHGGNGGMLFKPGHSKFVTGLRQDVCKIWVS